MPYTQITSQNCFDLGIQVGDRILIEADGKRFKRTVKQIDLGDCSAPFKFDKPYESIETRKFYDYACEWIHLDFATVKFKFNTSKTLQQETTMTLNTENMIELTSINSGLTKYWYDENTDAVYSTRVSGSSATKPFKLKVRKDGYYHFSFSAWNDHIETHLGIKEQLTKKGLIGRKARIEAAKANTPSLAECEAMCKGFSTVEACGKVEFANVPNRVKQKGWIIGNIHPTKRHIEFGENPVVHKTNGEVVKEMRRLATKFPGTVFIKFKIEELAVTQPSTVVTM